MSDHATSPSATWVDATTAIELFAVDPRALAGLVLRAPPCPERERLCGWLRALLPEAAPLLRVPVHITEDRLLGGLALAATLSSGRAVTERGVLALADGGVVIVCMAERLEANVTAQLCAALERGVLALERDGISSLLSCRIGVLALDEGQADERAPDALRERAAFQIDLSDLPPRAAGAAAPDAARVARARLLLPRVEIDDAVLAALCEAALALGIGSLRAPLLAATAARVHAALAGRTRVEEQDAVLAARLVLGPRATQLPDDADEEVEEEALEAGSPEPTSADERPAHPDQPLEDIISAAARSGVPAGLLETLLPTREPRSARRSQGRAGAVRAATHTGRPAGVLARVPTAHDRLNIVETLRACAPWQRLRKRSVGRLALRKEDFRITRFLQRTETTVVFCVDASGSAALERLAEAKGAVEQVLADCYVRRDHVALIAFRGAGASLLLPPTRSLTRVRRSLAQLAGGGPTPLAAGIDAAFGLALEARRRGRLPVVVLMTDGRGNLARDGSPGSAAGTLDALSSARAMRAAGVATLFLDTSPRPRADAQRLASELGARYLPLPYLDAMGISRHVQSLAAKAP